MDELSRTLVKWDKSYSTGVDTIDRQHQVLFELIAKLQRAMLEAKTKQDLPGILDRLVKYTEYHFAWEEQLLGEQSYPDLEKHSKAHAALKEQVVDFQKKLAAGKLAAVAPVMLFLRHWLSDHIKGQDLHYARYLREKGISPEAVLSSSGDLKEPA
jgi:hemerythrin-like metal-binding protein